MMRRFGVVGVFMALVASMWLAGCGGRSQSSTTSTASGVAQQDGADLPVDQRPKILGPPLGPGDSVMIGIAGPLAPWVEMWGQAIPGFHVDSLHRGGSSTAFRGGQVQPLEAVEPSLAGLSHRVFAVDSPTGRYSLIIDQFQGVVEDRGVLVASVGTESAPLLLDRGRRSSNRFATCGADCRFEWGAWIDSLRFVLAGSNSSGPGAGGYLDVYSIEDSSRVRYWTRVVSEDERRRYETAWGQWLRQRYRELKERRHS
jgi:hypothetical protein